MLAIRALELLSGKNYWTAMESEIFEPLGIKDFKSGGMPCNSFSAEDMARLGVLYDNHGKYGERELFSEKTYQAILPTNLSPYFPNIDIEWGIGLQSHKSGLGKGSYGHGGGCGTRLLVNPDKHIILAMTRNSIDKESSHYVNKVEEILREM
jgi:CubicO group peptidase (beta-lactamase class C family)